MIPCIKSPTAEERKIALTAIPPPRRSDPPRLTAGRIVYLLRRELPRWLRPDSDLRLRRARRNNMLNAEKRLQIPVLDPTYGPTLDIAMLTGRNYVPQTLYAMKSWLYNSDRPIRFTLVDDGTLDTSCHDRLRRIGNAVHIRSAHEINERLDAVLPINRYPVLRQLRLGYIHLRKLTDTFLDTDRHRIVVDTDVLIYKRPIELLDLYDSSRSFYFQDCSESYGLTSKALSKLAGLNVPDRINSGCFAFTPKQLDWDYIETISTRILATHGYTFYHEQALVAVLCAAYSAMALSDEYLVLPDETEARAPTRTALHYLDGANNPRMLLSWPLLEK